MDTQAGRERGPGRGEELHRRPGQLLRAGGRQGRPGCWCQCPRHAAPRPRGSQDLPAPCPRPPPGSGADASCTWLGLAHTGFPGQRKGRQPAALEIYGHKASTLPQLGHAGAPRSYHEPARGLLPATALSSGSQHPALDSHPSTALASLSPLLLSPGFAPPAPIRASRAHSQEPLQGGRGCALVPVLTQLLGTGQAGAGLCSAGHSRPRSRGWGPGGGLHPWPGACRLLPPLLPLRAPPAFAQPWGGSWSHPPTDAPPALCPHAGPGKLLFSRQAVKSAVGRCGAEPLAGWGGRPPAMQEAPPGLFAHPSVRGAPAQIVRGQCARASRQPSGRAGVSVA
ncbi:splicing factor 3A subunit 2-like [Alligator sinensis]|uniref:Splicing factor 3A subunit 2-like n=1 Tax=Alligator sinensis TaxID=38654 RepID=A0A3Q0HPV0_ALLSI|nr:splicing factor 3A subunit 2-like [Alligator sinensis]